MKPLLKLLLLFSVCTASASAVEKVDLFEAGKEGYALDRIPGIVVTKRGTVLAYCEARKSDRGDWGPPYGTSHKVSAGHDQRTSR